MMGKTIMAEQVYHNYGMTSKNTVKETGTTWTEIYKKVCPKTSGYFKYESEVKTLYKRFYLQKTCL